jgi:mannose-1-phosphate guanylyltransferase
VSNGIRGSPHLRGALAIGAPGILNCRGLRMTDARPLTPSRWCIVVADAAGPEWLVPDDSHAQWAPVQYCGLGEPTTMLQKALHRAARISHATRVVATVAEAHRSRWQQALWFTRPEHRYVSEFPGWSSVTTAAAVLSIAARAPTALVTILPARCYVADEWTLTIALHRALSERTVLADSIVTLGMVGADTDVDENYLLPGASNGRSTVAVSGIAQRPVEWVTRHLVRQGALVASDIYIGQANRLALLLSKYWPAVTHKLLDSLTRSITPGAENRIPPSLAREALHVAPRMSWDRPPRIPLRVLRVAHCGWSGLRSPRAIERIVTSQPNSLHACRPNRAYKSSAIELGHAT